MIRSPAQTLGDPAGIPRAALLRRVGTAILYAAVVLASLAAGPLATALVFGLMGAGAAAEFYALQRREGRSPNRPLGVGAALALPVATALYGFPGLIAVTTALLALSLTTHVFAPRVQTADTAATIFGASYTGFLLSYLVLVRAFESGLVLALALVVSVWVADVSAYFVGASIGRHRMAPAISPKKSWEGFTAGAIGCVGVWACVPFLPGSDVSLSLSLTAGGAVALAAVTGDLVESRMKREAGVKDSGRSLPGHGGLLDRLDSLIVTGLVAYWILSWGGVR